ncbi:hypothetical protein ScPMuIL_001233 [Solemya velum]
MFLCGRLRTNYSLNMALAKPQLRGLLQNYLKKNFAYAFLFSLASVGYYQFGVRGPRKQAYKDFYKNYDIEADFERMKKAGVFQLTVLKYSIDLWIQ